MKKFIQSKAAALLVIMLILQGCVSVHDVSSENPFSEAIGKKYVLLQDCYIYKIRGCGDNLFVGDAPAGSLPQKKVSLEFIGEKSGDFSIIGILREGTKFIVVRCEQRRSPEDIFNKLKCQPIESQFQLTELDMSDLTDMTKTPPVFQANLAKPID